MKPEFNRPLTFTAHRHQTLHFVHLNDNKSSTIAGNWHKMTPPLSEAVSKVRTASFFLLLRLVNPSVNVL